jgi:cell division protein FtsL
MAKRYVLIFLMVLTIPLFLAFNTWQSNKCAHLRREINRLEREQVEMMEKNREAAARVTELLAAGRLEQNARERMGLKRMQPEDIFLSRITGGKGRDL